MDLDTDPLCKILAGDRAGGDAHRRLAGRGAATAAIIADPVLLLVGVIGVAGSNLVLDLVVVARALIDVLDQEPDGRAGGHALEHAG